MKTTSLLFNIMEISDAEFEEILDEAIWCNREKLGQAKDGEYNIWIDRIKELEELKAKLD